MVTRREMGGIRGFSDARVDKVFEALAKVHRCSGCGSVA
jgi:hypothetical protein